MLKRHEDNNAAWMVPHQHGGAQERCPWKSFKLSKVGDREDRGPTMLHLSISTTTAIETQACIQGATHIILLHSTLKVFLLQANACNVNQQLVTAVINLWILPADGMECSFRAESLQVMIVIWMNLRMQIKTMGVGCSCVGFILCCNSGRTKLLKTPTFRSAPQ